MTSGGELGAESEVVETGCCSISQPCWRERGTGGLGVPRSCGTKAVPAFGHGEDIRGMLNEARVLS